MRANDSEDLKDTKNPYRDENIGVEKLLELNSEETHDDVCLAYVFTYRDFADGVLGLAWVGETGNQNYHLKFVTIIMMMMTMMMLSLRLQHVYWLCHFSQGPLLDKY